MSLVSENVAVSGAVIKTATGTGVGAEADLSITNMLGYATDNWTLIRASVTKAQMKLLSGLGLGVGLGLS